MAVLRDAPIRLSEPGASLAAGVFGLFAAELIDLPSPARRPTWAAGGSGTAPSPEAAAARTISKCPLRREPGFAADTSSKHCAALAGAGLRRGRLAGNFCGPLAPPGSRPGGETLSFFAGGPLGVVLWLGQWNGTCCGPMASCCAPGGMFHDPGC